MTDERFRELAAEHLEGALDAAGQDELARLIEGDERRRREFVDLVRQDRMLSAARRKESPETFARRVAGTLLRDRHRFVGDVMQDIRSPRGRWIPVAAAAAFLLLGIGLVFLAPSGAPPALARIADPGQGALVLRDRTEVLAAKGMTLRSGDRMRVPGPLQVTVRFVGHDTRIDVASGSDLRFLGGPEGTGIDVREGEVVAEVGRQDPARPFRIGSEQARAEVLGARLRVSVASDATRVEVGEGRVQVTSLGEGKTVRVPPRHFAVAHESGGLVTRPVPATTVPPPRITGFTLIRAGTPRTPLPGYEELRDGQTIDLAALPTRRVNLRANTEPRNVGSVRFSFAGQETFNVEAAWPYTIVPFRMGRGTWEPGPGLHAVTATPWTGSFGNGVAGEPRTIRLRFVDPVSVPEPTTDAVRITGFSLTRVNPPRRTLRGYEDLEDGQVIVLSELPLRRITLRADVEPEEVGSVRFVIHGEETRHLQRWWPYMIAGDQAWRPAPGRYTITAIPFTGDQATGDVGVSRTIHLEIVSRRKD